MSRNHLVTLIALSLCNCSLYVDSDESPGPRLADPSQLIGAWSSDDGLVIEFSPTGYMLTSNDVAAALSMRVLRFETVLSRPIELVVSDEACGDIVGRYEWRIDDDVLRFDVIDDSCEVRRSVMTKALRAMEPTITQLPDRHALNRFDDNLWLQDSKTGPVFETGCDDCSEEISLAAVRRGERWMTIESVTALVEEAMILAQCEVVFDLRATYLRLADPLERLAVRRVAVESDCSHQVGTVGYMAIEKTESGFSMWPLSAGFVRPLDEDVITEYLPLER